MERYPHILKVTDLGPITTDENGLPDALGYDSSGFGSIPVSIIKKPNRKVQRGALIASTALESVCREEPNDSGAEIETIAGEKTIYKSKIFLPLESPKIYAGTDIVVLESNGHTPRIKGRVIRYVQNQLNCVLWV